MSEYTTKVVRQWIVLTSGFEIVEVEDPKVVFQVDKIVAFCTRHDGGSWVNVVGEEDPWKVKETPEEILEVLNGTEAL